VARTSPSSIRSVISEPAVRVAAGVVFVIMLGYGLIVPVLPLYARSFGVGRTEVGVLVTTFALMRLVFDLVGGPLVDRFGERRVATAGALVVGVSSALSALAPSFVLLVVFRAIGGAGSSILFAAMMSYLVSAVRPDRMGRTMSVFYASFLFGTVLGQPIGGAIGAALGLAAPLWFYAAACAVSAVLILRRVRDVRGERRDPRESLTDVDVPLPSAWGRIRGLLSGRAFVVALFANAALFWTLGSVRTTLVPLFAQERVGLGEAAIGGVLGIAGVAQFLVMWKAGSLADARGRKVVLVPALAALALATAALAWATTTPLLAGALALLGVATGFAGVVPGAVVADVAPRRSGTAIGMYRFAGDVGFVLGPVIGGAVAETAGFTAAFLVLAAPIVLAFLAALRMPETLRRREDG